MENARPCDGSVTVGVIQWPCKLKTTTDKEGDTMENNFFEQIGQEIKELNLEDMEQVVGGKRRPYVRSMGKNVNVHTGPGTEYAVVAQLGYLDEVPVISKKIVRDGKGRYWAKITTGVSQNKWVDGWVCSQYCKGCWN